MFKKINNNNNNLKTLKMYNFPKKNGYYKKKINYLKVFQLNKYKIR